MRFFYRRRREHSRMAHQEPFPVPRTAIRNPFRHLSILDTFKFSSLPRSCVSSFLNDEPALKRFLPSLAVSGTALGIGILFLSSQAQSNITFSQPILNPPSPPSTTEPNPSFFPISTSFLPRFRFVKPPNSFTTPVITRTRYQITKLRVFVGFDSREELAYEVCRHSILRHASIPVDVIPIKQQSLKNAGLYTRVRGPTESTEFSFTRFLTPFLAGFDGWALFIDCDFLYTADVRELAELVNDQFAIMCVHHDHSPKADTKMDGVQQTSYPRKNWSSMVLYNCSHPKNKILTPALVSSQSGAFLHRFMWLEEEDIGEIPVTWNFLVGHNEAPKTEMPPKAIHYTSGGPWFEAWKNCEFADLWLHERDNFWQTQCSKKIIKHAPLQYIDNRVNESTSEPNCLGKRKDEGGRYKRDRRAGCSIADFMSNALCFS